MVCTPKNKVGLIGSVYFAGWSTTILFVPMLADKIGRKLIFFGSVFITGVAMVGMMLSRSI